MKATKYSNIAIENSTIYAKLVPQNEMKIV